MKTILAITLLLFISIKLSAQHTPNKWVIGSGFTQNASNNILDFNNGSLGVINPSPNPQVPLWVTNAAIGNSDSSLLFYTNGFKIYNAQHAIIQNGDTLSPCPYTYANLNYGLGLAQMAVFIPDPANSNRFYLFHASGDINYQPCANLTGGGYPNKLYYTLIDKTLGNGNGGVVSKNNIISNSTDSFGQSLLAIKHGNGRDWWLIGCHSTQSLIYRWLITPSGVSGPVVQNIGSGYCGGFWNLKFSSLTNTIAGFRAYFIWPTTRYIDLFGFDRCTGLLSNPQTLQMVNQAKVMYAGGCEFSLSGRYLYGGAINKLYQFDMLAANIQASKLTVDSVDSLDLGNYKMWTVSQLAPDGKIYSNSAGPLPFLSVINYPDSAGIACNAVHGGVSLPNYHHYDLPNIPLYELEPLAGSGCDTLTAINEVSSQNNALLVYPNPASNQLSIVHSQLAIGKVVTVTVYDVLGKVQLEQKIITNTIDVSTLAAGIYMLQVLQGDMVFNGRFVKE